MRLIDADHLRRWILSRVFKTQLSVADVVDQIDREDTIEPELHWIPCSDRLPEVDEMVLATTVWDDVTIAWRIGVDEWFIHEGGTNATTEDLSAWMPLPECYREGES